MDMNLFIGLCFGCTGLFCVSSPVSVAVQIKMIPEARIPTQVNIYISAVGIIRANMKKSCHSHQGGAESLIPRHRRREATGPTSVRLQARGLALADPTCRSVFLLLLAERDRVPYQQKTRNSHFSPFLVNKKSCGAEWRSG